METGTVKFYNEAKGFGFITPDNGGKDLYAHATSVTNGPIKEGDKVTFEIGQSDKGPRAENVSRT